VFHWNRSSGLKKTLVRLTKARKQNSGAVIGHF
jgi:hypothetical protein